MKRRAFLYSIGLGALTLAGRGHAAPQPEKLAHNALREVTRNIHAQFGSGFNIRSAKRAGNQTECVIENRGNFLVVTSQDNAHWAIRKSTDM